MDPEFDADPIKRRVGVHVLLPLFVAFFVDYRLIGGLFPTKFERAPALFVDPIAHFFTLDTKLSFGLEGQPEEFFECLFALEVEAYVYACWVVFGNASLNASTVP